MSKLICQLIIFACVVMSQIRFMSASSHHLNRIWKQQFVKHIQIFFLIICSFIYLQIKLASICL